MGRRSLANVRIAQIVEAASRCIATYGYQGATLERIATEAGLRRGHIRHYVGNRSELIDRVVDAVAAPYNAALQSIRDFNDPSTRISALLDHLFGADWGPSEDTQVFTALLLGAEQDAGLRERMRALYGRHHRAITDILLATASGVSRAEAGATSYAVMCLAYGNTVMTELAVFDLEPMAARNAAAHMISSLLGPGDSVPARRRGASDTHETDRRHRATRPSRRG
jgi:AcrR family transcriptional regulator